VVFVALNYRLGIFGWLSGDDVVTSSAGLLDQKLALE
jgi:carboxylesterase type B